MFRVHLVKTRPLQRHYKTTNTNGGLKINPPLLPHYAIYATFDRLCRKQPSMPQSPYSHAKPTQRHG